MGMPDGRIHGRPDRMNGKLDVLIEGRKETVTILNEG